jgi:hypothetical protein
MKRILMIWLALASALGTANPILAQGNAGTITGTVVDPSGASIAGATVAIENKVTGFNRPQPPIPPERSGSSELRRTPITRR